MKRYIKVILLSVTLLIGLTGCLSLTGETKKDGSSADNLDDEVIISQVKEQLKKNMDQIGFEVNVDDYSYKVQTFSQTGSAFGTVAITNLKYTQYGYIEVYKGSFGSKNKNKNIEFENVEDNPMIFISHEYAHYVEQNVFNNKELGNNVEAVLNDFQGVLIKPKVNSSYPSAALTGDGPRRAEIKINNKEISETRFLNTPIDISGVEYLKFFKGRSSYQFNYEELMKKMRLYATVGIYVNVTDTQVNEIQEKVKQYYNLDTVVIIMTNKREQNNEQ